MESNAFYTFFDQEAIPPKSSRADRDHRGPFQVDRDRIVFSFAFRRLQSKTQVFQSGEYDFYRTRLTHSIEVAKLGRSICEFLRESKANALHPGCYIDPDLTEAICLAHDLGHPPFGHIGERQLNRLMAPWGGFEGNAQTVRILSELIYRRPDGPVGMHPSRALLDGVMKYKASCSELRSAPGSPHPDNHFLYDEQAGLRQCVLGDANLPGERASLNTWKSIECQIMDWADDTAYSLNDIADGIQAGYITLESLERWRAGQSGLSGDDEAHLDALQDAIKKQAYERRLSYKLGEFIQGVELRKSVHPLGMQTARYRWSLEVSPLVLRECSLYKAVARDLIFQSPQIQQVEFKGSYILQRLFEAMVDHYLCARPQPLAILPREVTRWIRAEDSEKQRARRLCDFLAGLTDGEAVRLYRRLFDAEYGSITDLP